MTAFAALIDRENVSGAAGTDCTLPTEQFRPVVLYLAHVTGGVPIRRLARMLGCHASTVLRQVQRIEQRRDDPLLDEALSVVAERLSLEFEQNFRTEEVSEMVAKVAQRFDETGDNIDREARRILRRLCEKDAFLAVAAEMGKAVVIRESDPDSQTRTAVVDRDVVHQFALRDWITCTVPGRVARYHITEVGRASLKRLLEEDRAEKVRRQGGAEAATPFRAQHQVMGERRMMQSDGEKVVRFNMAESPLLMLGRKKDRSGNPYLTRDLIEAGERLREDFELAQMGPRITQNWDKFLTGGRSGAMDGGSGPAAGPSAARDRVASAMQLLGPGLSDVALRVCCFLEGLEAAEKRLGWSARSGKVVLKIALERLAMHYQLRSRPQL